MYKKLEANTVWHRYAWSMYFGLAIQFSLLQEGIHMASPGPLGRVESVISISQGIVQVSDGFDDTNIHQKFQCHLEYHEKLMTTS